MVFLSFANAFFMKARQRDIREAGFGFKELFFVKTPDKSTGWPQAGFSLAATHIKKGYKGSVIFSGAGD